MVHIIITPRDPLVSRDGRPFGNGSRMRPLPWFYPSVTTGSLRSMLGKRAGGRFDDALRASLKLCHVRGPLPLVDGSLLLPRPADALHGKHGWARAVPQRVAEVENLKLPGDLLPVLPPASHQSKADASAAWWSAQRMVEWLLAGDDVPAEWTAEDVGYVPAPPPDVRWHTAISEPTLTASEQTLTARDGMLYSTVGIDFSRSGMAELEVQISLDASATDALATPLADLAGMHPLGGERRHAQWQAHPTARAWDCPTQVADTLRAKGVLGVRLALATPAIFSGGWTPGWLKDGVPPGGGPTLRLRAACVERAQAISGWDFALRKPKAVRRMAPAGSVYYFEIKDGNPADLAGQWLQSVCDEEQDRLDGFGLALWSPWKENTT